jgi:hypothetical protein
LVALAGSLLSTLVSVFGAPFLQARREARTVLDRYRDPLLASAFELQSRLRNILHYNFLERYVADDNADKQAAALQTTLYLFAQWFGWREIIRREIQFLRFSRDRQTREVARLLRDIGETFISDEFDPKFMIWRVEQRGLGERMIVYSDGRPTCMGYASFLDNRSTMKQWLDPLERDLRTLDDKGRERLTQLQHLLLDLVFKLDEKGMRYPFRLEKV